MTWPDPDSSIRLSDGNVWSVSHVAHVSTGLETNGVVLYTTTSHSFHCTWWCVAWLQLLDLETHSMKLSWHFSGAYLNWRSVTDSAEHYALWPQYPIISRGLWLCGWVDIVHFCSNITDRWLWTGLVAQVAPYQSEFMELQRATGYLTDVCGNSRHCRITLSGWVSAYFEQYGKHVLICCHILGCIIKKYSSCTSHCGWSLHFRSFYVVIISNVHLDWDILLDGYWEA